MRDGKPHTIAFSGGLNSFEVARLCVKRYGPKAVECVFTDTCTEDEDLYRFVRETIAYLRCSLVTLRDGRDIWQVFTDRRFMGNSRVDPCSHHLKREMFRKYLSNIRPESTVLYYGIGEHELHRLLSIEERWKPFRVIAPLIATGTTKEQILHTLDKIGIAPPRLYELGFEHNNCGGFCVKSGQRQMALLLKALPKRYAHHEEQQEKLFQIIKPHGFIKRTVNGELEYLSLKQFRELVERGEIVQKFPDGACACFA